MASTCINTSEATIETVGRLREWAEAELARAGVSSPRSDAVTLTSHVCGWDAREFAHHVRDPAPTGAPELLAALAARRAGGEPLQLITGSAPFLELSLAVAPGVFIPRPETEGLALWAEESIAAEDAPVIVDLFAGVGPLTVRLARRRPDAHVVAVEVDERAATLLRDNSAAHGVRVDVVIGDVSDEEMGSRLPPADLVIANPPYVETAVIPALAAEVRDWEPRQALDGGDDGLCFYPIIAELAAKILKDGGFALVEIGETQGDKVSDIFAAVGDVEVGHDLAGRDRYVRTRKRSRI
jgi:release factor glutamine methyltransferase